ncbi:hypothetical protein EDC01DRAFT_515482 [Geopyxis carbonaria]|nr:hypothetical protein EDC01DRAFT_515482 [Geopyxis carbonaria]
MGRRKIDGTGAIGHLIQTAKHLATAPVNDAFNMHSYLKSFLRIGDLDLNERIWSFHYSTREASSTVTVIDCYAQLGMLEASGPFRTETALFDYILSTERKSKTSRIFVVEGIASWSVGFVGSKCKVPVDFFLDSTDENVQLKSGEGSETYTITMENACISQSYDSERKFLDFEALGMCQYKWLQWIFQLTRTFIKGATKFNQHGLIYFSTRSHT